MKSPQTVELRARAAFERFKRGLAHGEWDSFLEIVSDDFVFHFPQGVWRGEHRGKAKAREFFAYVSKVFPGGITVTSVDRVFVSGESVFVEFKDEGTMVLPGAAPRPYKNRIAIAFDFRGDKIYGYREYFGSDGTSH